MYTVSTARFKKQELLMMVQKNYKQNTDEFVQYIKEYKGDKFDNIDQWDIDELKNIIEQFYNHTQIGSVVEDNKQSQIIKQSSLFQKKIQIYKDDQSKYYQKQIQCKQTQTNQLVNYFKENSKDLLNINITEIKVVDDGILSMKYPKFKIDIAEFAWSVWRRFSDFEWLRTCLMTQFPGQLIPPIPKKSLQRFSDDHISKRKRMFELFLITILNQPLLRTSDAFIQFLSESDDQKFQMYQNLSSSIKKPQQYQDYYSIEGQIILEINPSLDQYFQNMTLYLENSDNLYQRTTNNSRQLFDCLQDVQQRMTELKLNVQSLKKLTEHFNQKNIVGNLGIIQFTYNLLEDYIVHWQKNLQDLTNMYKSSFYEFFRFQRDMQLECLELIKSRNKEEQNYLNLQKNLDFKKEKYFMSRPIEKWELGGEYDKALLMNDKKLAFNCMFFDEQQKILNKNRDQFAFMNRNLIDNFTSYFDIKGVTYTVRFLQAIQNKQNDINMFSDNLGIIMQQLNDLLEMRCGNEVQNLSQQIISTYKNQLSITRLMIPNDNNNQDIQIQIT